MAISCCGKTSQMALASASKDARGYAARNDWANGPNTVFLFVMRSFRATRQTVGWDMVFYGVKHMAVSEGFRGYPKHPSFFGCSPFIYSRFT